MSFVIMIIGLIFAAGIIAGECDGGDSDEIGQ